MKQQFATMKFDELLEMKAKVESVISEKLEEERKRLTASLEQLDVLTGAAGTSRGTGHKVLPPKYRNPANPSETWAGRGLRPRWLVEALKGGKKKLSDFAVDRD